MAKKRKEDINETAFRVVQTFIENSENTVVDRTKLRPVGDEQIPPADTKKHKATKQP